MDSETKSLARNLRLIEETGAEEAEAGQKTLAAPEPANPKENTLAVDLMFMALKALSQRTLIALASLQTILAIGSALFLAYVVFLPAPTWPQIIGTALYDGFVLIALWLSKRR